MASRIPLITKKVESRFGDLLFHFREPQVGNFCVSFAHRVWLMNFRSQVLEVREPTWN